MNKRQAKAEVCMWLSMLLADGIQEYCISVTTSEADQRRMLDAANEIRDEMSRRSDIAECTARVRDYLKRLEVYDETH